VKRIVFIIIQLSLFLGTAFSQQLKLWYNQPAEKWTDALPIGNGRLGAMIYGGIGKDHIQFNEETLWTGGPRDYNRKGAYKYLPKIRELLFEGKQKEAEDLAEEHFMGLKSEAGSQLKWFDAVRSLKGVNGNPAAVEYDDSKWKQMKVPAYDGWESVGFEGLDGAVWLRTTFLLPDDWAGQDLVLDLNRVRDQDFTYVNGKLIGSMNSDAPRKYVIPKEVLTKGKNVIAVQVLNYFDKGGIAGYKDAGRHIGLYPQGKEKNKLSLDGNWKYFIQDDEPPAIPHYEADYQPFGDLWLDFKGLKNVSNYKRELDLASAVAHTYFSADGVEYKRDYLASQPNQVITVHLDANRRGAINFEALLNSPHKYSSVRKLDRNTIALSLKVTHGALRGVSYLRVQATNGKIEVSGNKIIITNADNATLYLTAATNYKNYKDVSADPEGICRKSFQSLIGKTYNQVRSAHITEYQKYFNTFSINLDSTANSNLPTNERIVAFARSGDPSLVALYVQYGRYLLISSSRPGTRAANLQGIWNELLTPPWGSKYTTNINAEMNYWPAEILNLSPMHEPLFSMIDELAQTGQETAKEYYNAPGWVLHHNTDEWRGTAPINASNHGIWVSGAGWLSHHLWEHYLFTQDKQFLKNRAYPIMRSSADFFNNFLVKDPKTGWLISTPSNSPENGGLVAGPTMDHEIIRSLFKAVIQASKILNTDKTFRDSLQQKLTQIAPYQVGKYGQLQEWLQDIDDTSSKHRHVSHLWGVYPGKEFNWEENPVLMKAARQSLLYRGDAATGWSLAWKINYWARFKEGDHAYKLVQMLLSPAEKGTAGSYVNLFDAHPPFQIDGNFGGAAGVGEMLIQSHTKYVDLLPALPSALANGEVMGICARGGFQLNIKWENSVLDHADVLSLAGNDCLLRYNGKTLLFKTEKGKTYKVNGSLQLL
jgi:alpha-L-fucosidase 2